MPGIQNSKEVLDFLGRIGSEDRGDVLKLGNTARALVDLADHLITTARENMDKKGNTATGFTASSMRAKDIEVDGTKFSMEIELASTYKFLNDGVKGTERGKGKYSFKTSRPSKKMATAILKWARKRGLGGKTKYKAVSKNERKNKSLRKMTDKSKDLKGLAYAIATNIKKNGIDPTKFWTNAINDTKKKQKEIYAKALKLDIIESLNSN